MPGGAFGMGGMVEGGRVVVWAVWAAGRDVFPVAFLSGPTRVCFLIKKQKRRRGKGNDVCSHFGDATRN